MQTQGDQLYNAEDLVEVSSLTGLDALDHLSGSRL